jgi:hypothetical protein
MKKDKKDLWHRLKLRKDRASDGRDRMMRAIVFWGKNKPDEYMSLIPPVQYVAPNTKSQLVELIHAFVDNIEASGARDDWRVVYSHSPEFGQYIKEEGSVPVFSVPVVPGDADEFVRHLRKAKKKFTGIQEQFAEARHTYAMTGKHWILESPTGFLGFVNRARIAERFMEISEKAPPSEKMERFIGKMKKSGEFEKRYGDDWKSVLYATAWKNYNRTKNS